jgi:hypothetical protein
MTNGKRFSVVLLLGMLAIAAPSWAQKAPVADAIAKAYGLDSFNQIEQIRYTWTADAFNISRSWVWNVKSGQVSYDGKDKQGKPVKLSYNRSQLDREPAIVKSEIDPAFINDQYWLLFPLHLAWDGAKVEDTGEHKLPLGKGSARRIVVTYPSDGGYTPGDTWELFIGPDNRIRQWSWHRASSPKPTGTWAWEDYKKAGPLLLSLDHHGTLFSPPVASAKPFPAPKPTRIVFSEVAVKLAGSNDWVKPQ